MTLLDRIQNLQLRAVAADDKSKIKARVGDFTTLRNQIESAIWNATRMSVGRRELRAAGIRQDDPLQNGASVLAVIEDLTAAARTLSVDEKVDAVRRRARIVVDFFSKSEEWVQDNWQIALQARYPEVDGDLLDALENGGINVSDIRRDIDQAESVLEGYSGAVQNFANRYARLTRQ